MIEIEKYHGTFDELIEDLSELPYEKLVRMFSKFSANLVADSIALKNEENINKCAMLAGSAAGLAVAADYLDKVKIDK